MFSENFHIEATTLGGKIFLSHLENVCMCSYTAEMKWATWAFFCSEFNVNKNIYFEKLLGGLNEKTYVLARL